MKKIILKENGLTGSTPTVSTSVEEEDVPWDDAPKATVAKKKYSSGISKFSKYMPTIKESRIS